MPATCLSNFTCSFFGDTFFFENSAEDEERTAADDRVKAGRAGGTKLALVAEVLDRNAEGKDAGSVDPASISAVAPNKSNSEDNSGTIFDLIGKARGLLCKGKRKIFDGSFGWRPEKPTRGSFPRPRETAISAGQ